MQAIKFLLHPASHLNKKISSDNLCGIEKADSTGAKKRYLCGISSGMALDAHNDHMSEKCIKDFVGQSSTKDIPLYVNHGKDFTADIGLLKKSEITNDGEWYTEYQLHDDNPEADKVWKQANGLPPYEHARQFGFSIEGLIPEDGVISNGNTREITKVDLDPGVSLVTKPAYTSSIANAIAKAFNGKTKLLKDRNKDYVDDIKPQSYSNSIPGEEDQDRQEDPTQRPEPSEKTVKDYLSEMMEHEQNEEALWNEKWKVERAFQEAIDNINKSTELDSGSKSQKLADIFDSYKEKMVQLYAKFNYQPSDETENDPNEPKVATKQNVIIARAKVFKELGKLKKKISKGETMNEDLKTVLSDVIASLEMLLQAEEGENAAPNPDKPDSAGDTMEELKSVLEKMKSRTGKTKKEEPKDEPKMSELLKTFKRLAKEEAEPDKKKEEEEMKSILKKLIKLSKDGEADEKKDEEEAEGIKALLKAIKEVTEEEGAAKDEEGSIDDKTKAEDIVDDALETDEPTGIIKAILELSKTKSKTVNKSNGSLNSIAKATAANSAEISKLTKGIEKLFEGMGLTAPNTQRTSKGMNVGHDQEAILDLIADKIVSKQANPNRDANSNQADIVRKNAQGIAEIFTGRNN